MRIDMKREAEMNQRKGMTWRTIVAIMWFVVCLVLAYFLTGWLIDSGIVDRGLVYGTFSLPAELDMQIVRAMAIILMVVVLQFFAVVFFAAISPTARVRTGQATATAQSHDYYEQQYNRRA